MRFHELCAVSSVPLCFWFAVGDAPDGVTQLPTITDYFPCGTVIQITLSSVPCFSHGAFFHLPSVHPSADHHQIHLHQSYCNCVTVLLNVFKDGVTKLSSNSLGCEEGQPIPRSKGKERVLIRTRIHKQPQAIQLYLNRSLCILCAPGRTLCKAARSLGWLVTRNASNQRNIAP